MGRGLGLPSQSGGGVGEHRASVALVGPTDAQEDDGATLEGGQDLYLSGLPLEPPSLQPGCGRPDVERVEIVVGADGQSRELGPGREGTGGGDLK